MSLPLDHLLPTFERGFKPLLGLAISLLLLSSCSGLKYATEENPVFSDFSIDWTTKPEEDQNEIQSQLEGIVEPAPNTSLLGMRPTVALHNAVREPKKPKGLRNLLKNKIGNPATFFNAVNVEDINRALVNRMQNRGYFAARSSASVERKKRTASVVWTVDAGKPHRLRNILVGDSLASGLDSALAAHTKQLELEPGTTYNLLQLDVQRAILVDLLRNRGWYRLRADDLIWKADTAVGGRMVDVHLEVKAETREPERTRYIIGSVTLHGDHDPVLPPTDSTKVDDIMYVNYLDMYRPRVHTRGVFIKPGSYYSMRRSDATQRYLSSYGVFRSVIINYEQDSVQSNMLHTSIILSPEKRFSLFGEFNTISKSNNFIGPGIKVGFKDLDIFRGAEILTLDFNTRFETQLAKGGRGTNAYEISGKAGLRVPRMLLLPFLRTMRTSVPYTNIELGYGLFRRIALYGLESISANMGYSWQQDRRTWHEWKLLDVSYNKLYYTSEEFDVFLNANRAIRRSFDEQFIIGMGYTFTHSTKRKVGQRSWLVYTLGGDEGGLLTSGVFRLAEGPRPAEGYTLFSERYSQFVRVRPELRWNVLLGNGGSMIALRTMAHAALAYGNSTTVPYVKQFYAGGPNGLRGFRARSVGPGSYINTQDANLLIDQVGDVKLEMNAEYRFTFKGMFKGAVFADAGNVWLLKEDEQRPGGKFDSKDFISEVAFDAGFGLRIDPEVIVIRLDVAFPLHRPDLPVEDRWVFDDLNTRWSKNMILNIAIGYPF